MRKKVVKKKIAAKIPNSVKARIVELSLQNPEFGAKRLLPLLNSDNINVSASTVYNILRRNSLQTREKRLARLKEKTAKAAPASKKRPTRITPEAEKRIVEISLDNPDFGAGRLLPLLGKNGIRATASAIYRILKRNGLQNRDKRLARIEAQQAVENPPPETNEITPTPAAAVPITVEQPKSSPATIREKVPPARFPLVIKKTERSKSRKSWFLTLTNALLLAVFIYLGFYTVQNFHNNGLETEAIDALTPASVRIVVHPATAVPPIADYRIILERNLFNVSKRENPAPEKQIAIENITPAQKGLGIKLVGTVVADNAKISRAFIDSSRGEQETYREGGTVGEVRIKKILRNKVIISTSEGDRLLTVEIETTGKSQTTLTGTRQVIGSSTMGSQIPSSTHSSARTSSVRLDRQEVETSLGDIDQLLAELDISPYPNSVRPAGFRIDNISKDSIFRKIGLSSKDVIVGINDRKITSPEQAAEFLNTIAEGDEITIRAKRRLRTRRINVSIE
jgi:type II secretion system protein C